MKYLVTGGGTGGHIYPALAVCKGLLASDGRAEVLYVGTRAGLESQLVPREGITFTTIDVAGIMGKSPRKALAGALRATQGLAQAVGVIRRYKPDAVIGTGGYVSGPVVLAAATLRIRCAIQEQNAVPGFTNRMLSRLVSEVYTPFPGTERHFPDPSRCVLTGNPVRPEIMAMGREEGATRLGLDPARKTLFVFGGSRGARRILEVALELIGSGSIDPSVQVLLVTGRDYEQMAREHLGKLGIDTIRDGNLIVRPYLYSIEHALAASDLIIGRAGGMTVSEVLARGLPSILVPSPNVANNHQLHNARAASDTGGAILIREPELTAARLSLTVREILGDCPAYNEMASNARKAGRPNATADIVERLSRLASKR